MTNTVERTVILSMVPRFGTLLLLLFALTGNCSCVGFERDYMGDIIDLGASS